MVAVARPGLLSRPWWCTRPTF